MGATSDRDGAVVGAVVVGVVEQQAAAAAAARRRPPRRGAVAVAREACARARACGRTLAAEVAAAAAAVAERRRAEESRWTEAAERRGGGKDLTHELRACHRGETRPRGPGVGMCWDEACDYCDEKIYFDLYVEHQGWRRRNMVASFRGSGVGEEPRDIAIFVRVLCAVLLLSFPQLSSRRSRAGPAYRDVRRPTSSLVSRLISNRIVCRAYRFGLCTS